MFDQILEITFMNLRNINARRGASSVIIVGIAGVVAVLYRLVVDGGRVQFGTEGREQTRSCDRHARW